MEILEHFGDQIRKLVEACDSLEGFITYHSLGGGSGSGFTSMVSEQLDIEFKKKAQLEVAVTPGDKMSISSVEPYNAILNLHALMDHVDVCFLMDNDQVHDICKRQLGIVHPTFDNINCVIAQYVSYVTSNFRFPSTLRP